MRSLDALFNGRALCRHAVKAVTLGANSRVASGGTAPHLTVLDLELIVFKH